MSRVSTVLGFLALAVEAVAALAQEALQLPKLRNLV